MTEVRTYYGRSVLKPPVWRWMVPAYFFTGGVAAGSSLLGAAARLTGDHRTARRCVVSAAGAVAVSTVLLVEDLGRPRRFLNMLRVAKPTSPMSVGSWVLTAFGTATGLAASAEVLGVGRGAGRVAEGAAAVLAPVMATYTAVLVADTAVPAWHEAQGELPFVFAGSALASGAGLALALAPPASSGPLRRAAAAGAVLELAAVRRMERRLGELAGPYRSGKAGVLRRVAALATAAGGAGAVAAGRGRTLSVAAGVLLLGGSATERFAVFHAGVESARDPVYTVGPQRRRLEEAAASDR